VRRLKTKQNSAFTLTDFTMLTFLRTQRRRLHQNQTTSTNILIWSINTLQYLVSPYRATNRIELSPKLWSQKWQTSEIGCSNT